MERPLVIGAIVVDVFVAAHQEVAGRHRHGLSGLRVTRAGEAFGAGPASAASGLRASAAAAASSIAAATGRACATRAVVVAVTRVTARNDRRSATHAGRR